MKRGGIGNFHGLIGSECRIHGHFIPLLLQLSVKLQPVNRVIGCADDLHIHFSDQSPRTEFCRLQFFTGFIENRIGGIGCEQLGDPKIPSQFQVTPMIQRITQRIGHGLSPFPEFFPVRAVAGNVTFVHSIGPHCAPFIMIPVKPCFYDIIEPAVFCDLARRQMAVIVNNRHGCGVFMVEPDRSFRCKQKIIR